MLQRRHVTSKRRIAVRLTTIFCVMLLGAAVSGGLAEAAVDGGGAVPPAGGPPAMDPNMVMPGAAAAPGGAATPAAVGKDDPSPTAPGATPAKGGGNTATPPPAGGPPAGAPPTPGAGIAGAPHNSGMVMGGGQNQPVRNLGRTATGGGAAAPELPFTGPGDIALLLVIAFMGLTSGIWFFRFGHRREAAMRVIGNRFQWRSIDAAADGRAQQFTWRR